MSNGVIGRMMSWVNDLISDVMNPAGFEKLGYVCTVKNGVDIVLFTDHAHCVLPLKINNKFTLFCLHFTRRIREIP